MDQVHERFMHAALQAPVDEAHELSAPITAEEVAVAINALDVRKAGGPDGAQSFMLKWAADALIPELTSWHEIWAKRRPLVDSKRRLSKKAESHERCGHNEQDTALSIVWPHHLTCGVGLQLAHVSTHTGR